MTGFDWEKVRDATQCNDHDKLCELKGELLDCCENNVLEFMSQGVAMHAITLATYGSVMEMTPDNKKFFTKGFCIDVLNTFMKNHNIVMTTNPYNLNVGDAVQVKNGKNDQATYMIIGCNGNELELERTATSIEEYRGQKMNLKRSSKKILYGFRLENPKKQKNFWFFYF